jgi:hypothetical protein
MKRSRKASESPVTLPKDVSPLKAVSKDLKRFLFKKFQILKGQKKGEHDITKRTQYSINHPQRN